MDAKLQVKRNQIVDFSKDENFVTVIKLEDVVFAKQLVQRKIYSAEDLFYLLSAINLLNAAIKRDEFKGVVSYREIKGNISRVLNYLISIRSGKGWNSKVEFFINLAEKCAYIKVLEFQFSFHSIAITRDIDDFVISRHNQVKEWEGIRLQKVAGELFRFATQNLLTSRLN